LTAPLVATVTIDFAGNFHLLTLFLHTCTEDVIMPGLNEHTPQWGGGISGEERIETMDGPTTFSDHWLL